MQTMRQEFEARCGVRVEPWPADLSLESEIVRLAERLAGDDTPALLVNNAGFGTRGTLVHADRERQAAMLRLHTLAPMRLTMAVLPGMVRRGSGGIVNVSSVASFIYSAGNVNYCATKAYLTTFSEGLAAELRGTGVRAQALCPGFTRTEFHQRMQVGTQGLPAPVWLSARRVVRESLEALERGRPVICVPGVGYKLLVRLLRLTPRGLLGRGAALRRRLDVT
jgi:short-subunit dehydrogenase